MGTLRVERKATKEAQKGDLSHLKKIDKERLDKVLQAVEKLGMKFPTAEIEKKTGYGRSDISVYLNGKKPMSQNFYNAFIKHFCEDSNNDTTNEIHQAAANDHLTETLKDMSKSGLILSEANKALADANRQLAYNNTRMVDILQKPKIEGHSYLTPAYQFYPTIQKMAEAGVPELWDSVESGLIILGKLMISIVPETQQLSK